MSAKSAKYDAFYKELAEMYKALSKKHNLRLASLSGTVGPCTFRITALVESATLDVEGLAEFSHSCLRPGWRLDLFKYYPSLVDKMIPVGTNEYRIVGFAFRGKVQFRGFNPKDGKIYQLSREQVGLPC